MRFTIDSGVTGSRVMSTPNGESASATAFTTAGVEPIAPPSPTPLKPPGPGLGVSMWPYSITGTSVAGTYNVTISVRTADLVLSQVIQVVVG